MYSSLALTLVCKAHWLRKPSSGDLNERYIDQETSMGDAYRCRREALLQIFDRTAVQCLHETKLLEGAVNALLMATSKSMCGWKSLESPAIHCLACPSWAQPHLQSSLSAFPWNMWGCSRSLSRSWPICYDLRFWQCQLVLDIDLDDIDSPAIMLHVSQRTDNNETYWVQGSEWLSKRLEIQNNNSGAAAQSTKDVSCKDASLEYLHEQLTGIRYIDNLNMTRSEIKDRVCCWRLYCANLARLLKVAGGTSPRTNLGRIMHRRSPCQRSPQRSSTSCSVTVVSLVEKVEKDHLTYNNNNILYSTSICTVNII